MAYKLDEQDAHHAEDLRALGWEVEVRFTETDDELPAFDDAETFGVEHW
jgi:mannose/fructose/N-acetylgalactosamine-specific phosphotransferase system component IIB